MGLDALCCVPSSTSGLVLCLQLMHYDVSSQLERWSTIFSFISLFKPTSHLMLLPYRIQVSMLMILSCLGKWWLWSWFKILVFISMSWLIFIIWQSTNNGSHNNFLLFYSMILDDRLTYYHIVHEWLLYTCNIFINELFVVFVRIICCFCVCACTWQRVLFWIYVFFFITE